MSFILLCSANSYEPENGPIKSPWVPPQCLQSIPFTVGEAALVDYNITAVHAKKKIENNLSE